MFTLKERHELEIEKAISRIIYATARLTGAGVDEIDDAQTRRRAKDVEGRVVAMLATIRVVGLNQAETARRFGYADHSTISYLLRKFRGDSRIEDIVSDVCEAAKEPQLPLLQKTA